VNTIANHIVRPAWGAYWISPFDVWDRGLYSYCEYVCIYVCLRLFCACVVSFR